MLPQVVQQGPDIGPGPGQNREAVTRAQLGYYQGSSFILQHRGVEGTASNPGTESGGVLDQGGGQGGNGLGIECAAAGVLDRKTVAAEDENGLDSFTLAQAMDHVVQAGHQRSVTGEKGTGTYESLSGKSSKTR
jgi:hypothetical protein